ncbi:hypothetical protein [Paracoccus sp. (in: a-proteobacteria)]|uniref:hypothetical protein n=1 Tax=Paracoccus sp. TaxID=267 RepID=UPI00272BBF80|nr:hypothetical protein [Paracoccus sp. (in: a-proteobacteria)]
MIDDDDSIAAAEYVLGVTDLADRSAFEMRMKRSASLWQMVAEWESRLAGMNAEFRAMPAPDLLPGIEARLFGAPVRKSWRDHATALVRAMARPQVAVPVGIVVLIKAVLIWLLFLR